MITVMCGNVHLKGSVHVGSHRYFICFKLRHNQTMKFQEIYLCLVSVITM